MIIGVINWNLFLNFCCKSNIKYLNVSFKTIEKEKENKFNKDFVLQPSKVTLVMTIKYLLLK